MKGNARCFLLDEQKKYTTEISYAELQLRREQDGATYPMKYIRRGEIYNAALGNTVGSEQGGLRPVLILQRSRLCRSSPTVIVVPITSHLKYPSMRAHHVLDEICPLHERSMVLTEQIRAIDKRRLGAYIGRLQASDMLAVGQALHFSLGLRP